MSFRGGDRGGRGGYRGDRGGRGGSRGGYQSNYGPPDRVLGTHMPCDHGNGVSLTMCEQRWVPSSTQPKANSSAAASIPKSPTSTHPSTSRTRHPSAKSTKSSVPSTKSTSPSSHKKASRRPASRRATNSTLVETSYYRSRSSCRSPNHRPERRKSRSRRVIEVGAVCEAVEELRGAGVRREEARGVALVAAREVLAVDREEAVASVAEVAAHREDVGEVIEQCMNTEEYNGMANGVPGEHGMYEWLCGAVWEMQQLMPLSTKQ